MFMRPGVSRIVQEAVEPANCIDVPLVPKALSKNPPNVGRLELASRPRALPNSGCRRRLRVLGTLGIPPGNMHAVHLDVAAEQAHVEHPHHRLTQLVLVHEDGTAAGVATRLERGNPP
jgi:hypothetical protein